MNFIEPQDIPGTGNLAIDLHHRRIAGLVNDLYDGWRTGWSYGRMKVEIGMIMAELADHFVAEKAIARGAGFPGWDDHEALHARLERRMAELSEVAQATRVFDYDTVAELFAFFEDLFFDHEVHADQEFRPFFETLEIPPEAPLIPPETGRHDGSLVDRQHTEMTERLNDIHAALQEGRPRLDILGGIDALITCTVEHFNHEEALMREAGHPDLDIHAAAHRALINDVNEARRMCKGREMDSLHDFVDGGLKYWFIDHIANWDARIHAEADG